MAPKGKVLLGMSGGVDSSVSAILLQERGYEVIGATMKLWTDEVKHNTAACSAPSAASDAKQVCDQLGIAHYTFDYSGQFRKHVIEDFITSYARARTPNPCVECNRYLKFGLLAEEAEKMGIPYLATGHYARIEFDEKYGQQVLKKAPVKGKDQSYFLYAIPRDMLNRIIFPLGGMEDKDRVRSIAAEHGLIIAQKPESQEICFISGDDYGAYLEQNLPQIPAGGDIIDMEGRVLGHHRGLIHYTVGQRKGLGIAAPHPLYVIALNKENNTLIVGEEDKLYTKTARAANLRYLMVDKLLAPCRVRAKIRYRAPEVEAWIHPVAEDLVEVEFAEAQRAVTPGQSIVFYLDDCVFGGGKII